MHSDLEKLKELGRISDQLAQILDQISPGKYCTHRTWGTGEVKSWNLAHKQVTIDFQEEKSHNMALGFAVKNLVPLKESDFLVERYKDIASLQALATNRPLDLLAKIIECNGVEGKISIEDVEALVKGSVITPTNYKKWWDKVKSEAQKGTRYIIPPARKGALIVLREQELTKVQALVIDYKAGGNHIKPLDRLKSRVTVLEGAEAADLAKEPQEASELFAVIEKDLKSEHADELASMLQLAVLRDKLIDELTKLEVKDIVPESVVSLADIIVVFDGGALMPKAISSIPGSYQKRIYDAYPEAFGDDYVQRLFKVLANSGTRAVTEVAKYFCHYDVRADETDEIKSMRESAHLQFLSYLQNGVASHSLNNDALIWICRERKHGAAPVLSIEVAFALLAQLDKEPAEGTGNSGQARLVNYVFGDQSLIDDLIDGASATDVRRFAKALITCPNLGELDRKSLFARILHHHPDVHDLILKSSEEEEEDYTLIVSWESLERKKLELENIVKVLQPQNVIDIKVARAHGDLRENGDYKAAKEEEKKLGRQRADLERDIQLARGTDFSDVDTSVISIGTVATLKIASGESVQFTILGVWDSDPEQNIISYKTKLGATLLGAKVGDIVEVYVNDEAQSGTVEKIEAFKK